MRRIRILALLALMAAQLGAQQSGAGPLSPYSLWGQLWASAFGQWSVRSLTQTTSAGTYTLKLDASAPPVLPGNIQFQPLATNAPLLIDSGANQETATPSAVNCSWGSGICQITVTLAKAHPANFSVASATGGLQEAINYQTNPVEIHLSSPLTLTAPMTVPSYVALAPQPSAVLSTAGSALTINGPIEAGAYQIFNTAGGGAVSFAATGAMAIDRPEWWGASTGGVADTSAAMQAAIQAWATPSSPVGGTVQLGAGTYYIAANVYVDRGVTLEGNSAASGANVLQATRILTAPGVGLVVTYAGPDGGQGNAAVIRDLAIECQNCQDTPSGYSTGGTRVTVAHPAYWAVNDLVTGNLISPNTYVTAVSGSTLTLSQGVAAPAVYYDNGPIYVGATAAQQFTGTTSTSACTITGLGGNTSGLFAGEVIQGPNLPAQSFIRSIMSGTITYSSGPSGACTDATASGASVFWPVKSAIDGMARTLIYNASIDGAGGTGIALHGNTCSCSISNYTNVNGSTIQDTAVYYTGLDDVAMQGTDANAIHTSNLDLMNAGWGACLEDDGTENTHVATQIYACGRMGIDAPFGGDAFVAGYTEINTAPTYISSTSVAPFGSSGGGGDGSWGANPEHNNGGKQWYSSPLTYGTATYQSTCLTGVNGPTMFHVGQPIRDGDGILATGTTVTAINSCGSGSGTITMSAAATQSGHVALWSEIALGTVGNSSASYFGNGAWGLAATVTPGTTQDAYQWQLGLGEYDQFGAPYTALDGTWEMVHGMNPFTGIDLSTEESTQGDFPPPYYGYARFPTGPYIGYYASECHLATPVNAQPTAGGYRACDTAMNNTGSGGVWAWTATSGGKSVTGTGTLSAGNATVTGLSTAAQASFAPGDAISGTGIAPGATVVAVSGATLTMSKAASASGTESIGAYRYGAAHPATTITTSGGSASATLSVSSGWSQYDTIQCANCAAGTYINSINGSAITLSQNATASGTVTAYDATFAQVPEGPAGATAQVALSWSLSTTASSSDVVAVAGITSGSKCVWSAANATAAADSANIYLVVASGQIMVHHSSTAGESLMGLCTPQ